MDPLVIASPHFDDAVLSCGQVMAGRPDCVIVTVFAHWPVEQSGLLTDFDRRSGFTSATHAVTERRIEDDLAARVLHASTRRCGFVDDQYRDGAAADVDGIVGALLGIISDVNAEQLVAPLGLAHPDHVAVSEAALTVAARTSIEVVLYEELPSRVLWPEQVCSRLVELRDRGFSVESTFIGTGPVSVKGQAVSCYRSQTWALERRCLFVPERFHAVTV